MIRNGVLYIYFLAPSSSLRKSFLNLFFLVEFLLGSSRPSRIKDMIMITEEYGLNRVELVRLHCESYMLTTVMCTSRLPDTVNHDYSLASVSETDVILAEGVFRTYAKLQGVYKGTLNQEENDIDWKGLPSLQNCRSGHISFYLGSELCIFGGRIGNHSDRITKTSEVFSISKESWSEGPNLPGALTNLTAETNQDQTIALVIGWHSGEESYVIYVFEKGTGFFELTKLDLSCSEKVSAQLI